MSRRLIGTRCSIARTRTGSVSRRSNVAWHWTRRRRDLRRRLFTGCDQRTRASVHLGLAGIGDDLLELGHAQHAGHAVLADDEGRGAAKAESFGLFVIALEDGIDVLGVFREVALQPIHIDAGGREQLVDARLGQARADAHHGVMGLVVLVLEFGRQRDPRRRDRDRPEDWPILHHQPDLAVVLDDLAQLRLELAAIGTIVVRPFDDADVAVGITGHRRVGIAQHPGFGQHLILVSGGARRIDTSHQDGARPEQRQRRASSRLGAAVVPKFSHMSSRFGPIALATVGTGYCYAPYRVSRRRCHRTSSVTASGTMNEVTKAFRLMAMPENTPAISSTWNARAVPMPCAARPAAKPRARKSVMPVRFISAV